MTATCRIRDVHVHDVTLDQTLEQIDAFVQDGQCHQIVTVNLDFVRIARSDAPFRAAVQGADLAVADGVPVVWMSRLLRTPVPERVTGVDIVERGAALAAAKGYRIFLLGAEPGVADLAAAELCRRNPGLVVAGTYAPPMGEFSAEEATRIATAITSAKPDLLFVAFGAPKQDVWIHQHLHDLGVPVCVGIGGVFNFLAGRTPRAPRAVQRVGLEWAYRLIHDPRRLFRRYILHDLPLFLTLVSAACIPLAGVRGRLLAARPLLTSMVDAEA